MAAENTFAIIIGIVAAGDNFAFRPAIPLRDSTVDHQLITCLNASSAKDAAAEIADYKRVLIFSGIYVFCILFFELQVRDFIKISQILQTAIAIGLTGQAIMPACGQQQLDIEFSGLVD